MSLTACKLSKLWFVTRSPTGSELRVVTFVQGPVTATCFSVSSVQLRWMDPVLRCSDECLSVSAIRPLSLGHPQITCLNNRDCFPLSLLVSKATKILNKTSLCITSIWSLDGYVHSNVHRRILMCVCIL